MSEQPVVQFQSDARATIATILCREFDFAGTTRFRNEVAEGIGGDSRRPLILDLSNVGYMPSVTLGALVELRNRCAKEQRPLTLVGIQPAIHKMMKLSGMLALFEVRDNVAAAMPPS